MEFKQMFAASAVTLASIGGLAVPSTALAASQDECAIWICLPGGFPSGCGAAHSAMMDRIKDRKSPLPSFGSCAVKEEGHSEMSYNYSVAAYIPARQVCTKQHWWGDSDNCSQWETAPSHYVKGTRCQNDDNGWYPEGCTRTYRFVDVFVDGVLAGDTYYW
uniref:conjugal transfer protein TraL n=1 Tax=Marinobacterium profundum TaxID=1714300 RepID=UPI00082AB78E|nr:conjugal transfer protein TraL [Marinobacterium profundum]